MSLPAKVSRKYTLPVSAAIRVGAPRIGATRRRRSGGDERSGGQKAVPGLSTAQQGSTSEEILFRKAQNEPPELINTFRLTGFRVIFNRKIAVGSEFTGEVAELL